MGQLEITIEFKDMAIEQPDKDAHCLVVIDERVREAVYRPNPKMNEVAMLYNIVHPFSYFDHGRQCMAMVNVKFWCYAPTSK